MERYDRPHGHGKKLLGLWLPRTLVGVGEAILIPAASKILSTRFDGRHSATVFGLLWVGIWASGWPTS